MLGVIINSLGVAGGGLIGLFLKNAISEDLANSLYSILGILVLLFGIKGSIQAEQMFLILVFLCLGTLLGNILKLSDRLDAVADSSKKFDSEFLRGAITVFLVQGMGAMAILGPLEAGLKGDISILLFKAALDFISSIIFGSIYGRSLFLTSILLFLYQGAFFVLSLFLTPILTSLVVDYISQIGSVILIALSIEMLGLKEMKVVNYLPSLLIPLLYGIFI